MRLDTILIWIFFHANPIEIIKTREIMDGVLETLERLVPDPSCQDEINIQMSMYQNAGGIFRRNLPIRKQNLKSPGTQVLL